MKKRKVQPRFWMNLGHKYHRVIPITEQIRLSELDAAGWTAGQRYLLHVDPQSVEWAVPDIEEWDGRSMVVTVAAVGETYVHESARVSTVLDYEGVKLIYRVIPPHGAGWERDEPKDRPFDKWSAWQRTRKLEGK